MWSVTHVPSAGCKSWVSVPAVAGGGCVPAVAGGGCVPAVAGDGCVCQVVGIYKVE